MVDAFGADNSLDALKKYNSVFKMGHEIEVKEEALARLLPYFEIQNSKISKLSYAEQAKAIMANLKLTSKMRLRKDIDPKLHEMFSELVWFDGGECVEFKHREPVSDAHHFVENLYLFTEVAGLKHRILEPTSSDKSGGWYSYHIHISKTEAPNDLTEFSGVYDLAKALKYMQHTTPSFAFGGGFSVYKPDPRSKGATRLVQKNRTELRRRLTSPHEELFEFFELVSEDPKIGIERLVQQIASNIKAENVTWVFENLNNSSAVDWLVKVYVLLEQNRPELLGKLFTEGQLTKLKSAASFYKTFNSEARTILRLSPEAVFKYSSQQLESTVQSELVRIFNSKNSKVEQNRLIQSLAHGETRWLRLLKNPVLAKLFGSQIKSGTNLEWYDELKVRLDSLDFKCSIFGGM